MNTATILRGDAVTMLRTLPAQSVHCCVTSPPYFGLRDYGTATWEGGDPECDHKPDRSAGIASSTLGGGKKTTNHQQEGYSVACPKCGAQRIDKQLGMEPTPAEYVANMVAVFAEVWRVLRDDGTLWLNVGDSYAGNGSGTFRPGSGRADGIVDERNQRNRNGNGTPPGLKQKDLVGIPWRLAFALQDAGWYLRSDVIWCLSGGSWVYARTQKGDMPMMVKDMARLNPKTVKLWNGEKWTQVLGMSKSDRRGDELEIVLRSGERISCTPTHQWPTSRGLLRADELQVGDALDRVGLPEPDETKDSAHIGVDAAWFAGLYIAEGSRADDTIQISGHSGETVRWERVKRIAESYGGSATRTIDGNNMSIRVYGKILNAIIDMLVTGKTADDKGFSPIVWRYSDGFIAALMEGYLSGDGHWDESNNRWRIGFTRNYNLERDIRTACARLGWHLILNLSSTMLYGRKFPAFKGEIRLTRSGHHNEKNSSEVMEIRKAKCRQVYDIGVEDEPHVFALASGILTHNSKPNPMPESVTDRPTKSHEYVFLLTKRARYFYDAAAVAEASIYPDDNRKARSTPDQKRMPTDEIAGIRPGSATYSTRNRRSVWTINPEPTPYAHFATMPTALVEPCILAGTSARGVCPECGAPWVRVVERKFTGEYNAQASDDQRRRTNTMSGGTEKVTLGRTAYVQKENLGWQPSCTCDAGDPIPATVLDPFAGSGTTLRVAVSLGRDAIGIELNPEYADLAERLLAQTQPALIAV